MTKIAGFGWGPVLVRNCPAILRVKPVLRVKNPGNSKAAQGNLFPCGLFYYKCLDYNKNLIYIDNRRKSAYNIAKNMQIYTDTGNDIFFKSKYIALCSGRR